MKVSFPLAESHIKENCPKIIEMEERVVEFYMVLPKNEERQMVLVSGL